MEKLKKSLVTIAVLVSVLCMMEIIIKAATPTIEAQIQPQWELMRSEADEDSSTLDLTSEGDFANMPSGAYELSSDGFAGTNRKVSIITCAGSEANKTYTVTFYGYKRFNGPAQRIMSVDYTTGTQAVVQYLTGTKATATNKFWADTAIVTEYRGAVARYDADGNNGVAELVFYSDFTYIVAELTSADGVTGSEAGDVSIYICTRN